MSPQSTATVSVFRNTDEALEAKLAKKDNVIAEISEEHVALKKTFGALTGCWLPHDTRDEVTDFIARWSEKTEISATIFARWLGIARGKFYEWKKRYGEANEHNGKVPRDHWIEHWERQAILDFHDKNTLEGYRRLAFIMLDQDVVAVSPSTVYRALKAAGRLDRWNRTPSKKGTGFHQPSGPHHHWHIDISYLNTAGTFYYLSSILDGYSRYTIHWEIRETMKEEDVETILQRAHEKLPKARPRIISDNGPQFIARDFKVYIRQAGMTYGPHRTTRGRTAKSSGGTRR